MLKNMALCEGRHLIPEAVDGAIFPEVVNPLDIKGLEEIAYNSINLRLATSLNLYVTGLTVALVTVINYCKMHNIDLTLYHYDRNTNSYYPQKVY